MFSCLSVCPLTCSCLSTEAAANTVALQDGYTLSPNRNPENTSVHFRLSYLEMTIQTRSLCPVYKFGFVSLHQQAPLRNSAHSEPAACMCLTGKSIILGSGVRIIGRYMFGHSS
ncbi:hypothetical protein BJ741DRAFT_633359 [Chytriomyces cf. hyalinus JEL632]|nr:hypothetical protein BJ741DRAFT_633359 [Chytriomyces cf. hyalinus JEL632]